MGLIQVMIIKKSNLTNQARVKMTKISLREERGFIGMVVVCYVAKIMIILCKCMVEKSCNVDFKIFERKVVMSSKI